MYTKFREWVKSTFSRFPFLWNLLQSGKSITYVFNYLKYYRFGSGSNKTSIREINIEFASACNLRCKFCSLDHEKPKVNIKPEILEQALTEIAENRAFRKVEVINLYNGGETLLHPKRLELFKMIAKHKAKAKKNGNHFPRIMMLTNGMLLREQLAKQILETKALDTIQFSLDGGTPESFEDLRVNAKWKPFYENVKNLDALRKELQPNLKMKSITIVENKYPLNISWMHPEFQEIVKMMDHYELRRLHDWGGEVDLDEESGGKPFFKIGCNLLMHQMVLLPNGDVTVCCNDLNSKGVVGNIVNSSLFEVYNSAERRLYIDKLLQGKRQDLELCKNCQSF